MVLAQGRMPDAMEDSEVRMMKCMESYGIMEDKDVCKAVLDCFGRWEKDGNMRRNEIVTPSFCPSLVFIFANMFCHGLTCMDCFVNCDSVLIFG